MWKECKEFALRGNVIDLAVGFVTGAAFGKIVTFLVEDVLVPPVGLLLGRVDFSNSAVMPMASPFPSASAERYRRMTTSVMMALSF